MRTFFKVIALAIAAVVLLYVIAAAVVGRTELLALLFGPVERQAVDFISLERRTTPNDFLACPAEVCAATADIESPVIGDSVDHLRLRFLEIVAASPRLTLLAGDPVLDQYDVEERSDLFGFPDTMTVRLFERRDGTSTVAIYSRSHYGKDDLGVNEARVRAWLDELAAVP
jgi:hypothetical protein